MAKRISIRFAILIFSLFSAIAVPASASAWGRGYIGVWRGAGRFHHVYSYRPLGYYANPWVYGYPYWGYAAPYYLYSAPAYSFAYSSSFNFTPGDYHNLPPVISEEATAQDRPKGPARTAYIDVRLPSADAELWCDGTRTAQSGIERAFESPALAPGAEYTYELRAKWKEGTQTIDRTSTVRVHAGDEVTVDFTQPQRESLPRPREK